MIWIFFEDVNDGSVMELCFLEEIGEGIYEQLAIYIFKKKKKVQLETRKPTRLQTRFFGLGLVEFQVTINPTKPDPISLLF